MNPKAFVAVLACVMVAGMAMAELEAGHIRPKSVIAACSLNSAQVSWEAVLDANLTGYDVYKKVASDPAYAKVNLNPTTETHYTVPGLASTTTYSFAVTAVYNDGNASELSVPAICTTG